MGIVEFLCWAIVVGLIGAWLLTLADKWGIREWLQVHAPNDLLYELFSCNFCCSFHLSMIICLVLAIFVNWWCIFIPPISCIITIKFYRQ